MSEKNLERIADALERIVAVLDGVVAPLRGGTVITGGKPINVPVDHGTKLPTETPSSDAANNDVESLLRDGERRMRKP